MFVILGLAMTTRGGYYIFQTFDEYVFRIPAAITNTLNVFIFVWLTDCKSLFSQLSEISKEKVSECSIYCLKYINIWVFLAMIVLGIVYTEFTLVQENPWTLNILGH